MPLLQPQNVTHFMFLSLQRHILVLIHDVGHLHGGGRSSGLHNTGSITGVMPTSVASYPYWSGSGLVTAGVGACNHIVHCRYARFMCSCIVDEHTSWLKSSSWSCGTIPINIHRKLNSRSSFIQTQGIACHLWLQLFYTKPFQ